MKILIVDDEETLRRFLSKALKTNGFEVATLEDAAKTVPAALAERADLILMDLEMPGVSGEDAILALKADPATRSIPVIVLTGMATPEAVKRAIRAGAQDFVVKGEFQVDSFMARLRRAVPAPGAPSPAAATPTIAKGTPGPPAPAERKSAPPSILDRDRIDAKIRDSVDLKALPFIAAEALKITAIPNADVGLLEQTLLRDPALSATLLQLSNSAFFTPQSRVQSLNQAIMRMGLRRVGEMVTAIKLVEEFRGSRKKGEIDRVEMWRHALATAVLARELAIAGKLPTDTVESAFLAGLLHDLGQAFLADHFPGPYGKVLAMAAKRGTPLGAVERQVCGTDHAEIARRILSKWQLHPELVEAVSGHEGAGQGGGLPAVVWLANLLARTARIGTDGDDTVDFVPDALVGRIGIDGERVERSLADLDAKVRQLSDILLLHHRGDRPSPAASPPLRENVRAVTVLEKERQVEPAELLLKRHGWKLRRVSVLGESAADPQVQALLILPQTNEWLRTQLEEAAKAGAKAQKGRRPLVVCLEGEFPSELKGPLRSVGGEALESPLSLARLIRALSGAGESKAGPGSPPA